MTDDKTLRAVMIMTSHGQLGRAARKTGVWLESFVAPYFALRDAGIELTLASPAGGMPPIDPVSRQVTFPTAARFAADDCCRAALADTLPLTDIYAEDFDAAFYCGGFGAYWDLAEDPLSAYLIADLHGVGKPVAFIGAAVAALCPALGAGKRPLAEGKRVTGYSDDAARSAGIFDTLPFSLQQRLGQLGAIFEDSESNPVIRDGLLVTSASDSAGDAAAEDLLHIVRSK